jgi:hypothetical protein
MVADRNNLSRRAVLGASVGAPAMLVCSPAPAADLRQPWERALAAFRHAEARLACFLAQEASLSAQARTWPGCEAIEEGFNDLECLRIDALKRLLRVPAPNLRSLSLKVDLTVDEEVATLTGGERCLAMLKADARRLAYGG